MTHPDVNALPPPVSHGTSAARDTAARVADTRDDALADPDRATAEGAADTLQIRPYREADESAVIALWHACGLTRPWNDPRKDIARKLMVQRELFLVGTLDGKVVATAMAGFEGHRGWVNYLAVAPAWQGRGFGAGLMAHIEAKLTAAGCPKINLLVRSSNHAVLDFYRRLGYLQDEAVPLGKRLIPDA